MKTEVVKLVDSDADKAERVIFNCWLPCSRDARISGYGPIGNVGTERAFEYLVLYLLRDAIKCDHDDVSVIVVIDTWYNEVRGFEWSQVHRYYRSRFTTPVLAQVREDTRSITRLDIGKDTVICEYLCTCTLAATYRQ
jgi:hypothetical protein